MPAISGSYQYTWSVASPVAPNNSLATTRQVDFPSSLASQPQHCYPANSLPQLSSQNFPHVTTSLPPTTSNHACNALSQPLYQNQCTNSSLSSDTSDHQRVSPVQTTSVMSQSPLSTSSQPTSHNVTTSNPTSTSQQIITTSSSSGTLQSHYAPKAVQHVLMVNPPHNALPNSYSPSVHVSPTQLILDKNNSGLSGSQQLTNQKGGATAQQTYMPM
nr:putative protein TPRXL [Procambarus clarkii]